MPWVASGLSKSHRLTAARCDDGTAIVICLACGAWGSQRARLLAKPCSGAVGAGPGGVEAVRRVGLGRHPHPSYKARLTEMLGNGRLAELYPESGCPPVTSQGSDCNQGPDGCALQLRRKRALAKLEAQAGARRHKCRNTSTGETD